MTADPAGEGWKEFRSTGGFERHVGPLWAKVIEPGRLSFAFRAGAQHSNPHGVVHGGMLVTFIDQVLGALAWYVAGKKPSVTLTLNSDFVSPARVGDWIEGRGKVVRNGRSLIFLRGEAMVGERVVLSATGIWKVLGVD
jgi:uncharacterized protein (TIGR00369 family)